LYEVGCCQDANVPDAAAGAGVAITCELDGRSAADIGAALQQLLHDVISGMQCPTIQALVTDLSD